MILQGQGERPPQSAVQPTSVNFGTVPVQQASDASFTVVNSRGGTLTGSVSTTAPFSIVGGGSFSLGLGQRQTVTVRFTPTAAGVTNNSKATISSNGGTGSVSLVGIGGASELPQGPLLTIVDSNLDFGAVGVGKFLDSRNLTIKNSGVGTLNVTTTASPPFSIVDGANLSLAEGQGYHLTVRFSPTAVGPVTGQINFTSNGGNAGTPASGTGTTP